MKNIIVVVVVAVILMAELFLLFKLVEQRKLNDELSMTSSKNIPTTESIKKVKLEFQNPKCNSKETIIYECEDGRKIYSRCGEIYFINEKDSKMKLGDAIKENIIIPDDIGKQMEQIVGVFDGGTVVYENKDLIVSTNNFRLEICNQFEGKHDILFLSYTSDNYKCA